MDILKIVIESNIFNFLIMIVIFAIVFKKLEFSKKLDETIIKIKESIEKSQAVYEESVKELNKNIEKTNNVSNEIEEIKKKGQENLENLEKKISQDSESQISAIKMNADRLIDTKKKEMVSELSRKTILASVEVAKKHIVNLLEQYPEYHRRLIRNSIEELDRLAR